MLMVCQIVGYLGLCSFPQGGADGIQGDFSGAWRIFHHLRMRTSFNDEACYGIVIVSRGEKNIIPIFEYILLSSRKHMAEDVCKLFTAVICKMSMILSESVEICIDLYGRRFNRT